MEHYKRLIKKSTFWSTTMVSKKLTYGQQLKLKALQDKKRTPEHLEAMAKAIVEKAEKQEADKHYSKSIARVRRKSSMKDTLADRIKRPRGMYYDTSPWAEKFRDNSEIQPEALDEIRIQHFSKF